MGIDAQLKALHEAIHREAVTVSEIAARRKIILDTYADMMGIDPALLDRMNEAERKEIESEVIDLTAHIEAENEARDAAEDEAHFKRFGF